MERGRFYQQFEKEGGKVGWGEGLPGDERARLERINRAYHTLDELSSIAGAEGRKLQREEYQYLTKEGAERAAKSNDILYVDAALGLLAYRSLDNESIARLIDTLRVEHNLHQREPEKSESKTDMGFTGRFVLTPEQNEILVQITTALDVPYDRQKTQYTYTVVDNFPQEDPYVISSIEVPKVVEGN